MWSQIVDFALMDREVRVINVRQSTREYLLEFFPRKLSLSHNREECTNGQDISFRDDYEQFLTRLVSADKGSVASFSLVACICKTSLLQLRNQMRR